MRDAVVCRVWPLHHCDEYRDVSATPSSEMPLMAAIGASLGRGGDRWAATFCCTTELHILTDPHV
jgi:hypothetical protein